MYYIFAFRSRHESMNFFDCITSHSVLGKIISTPRSISVGCGLSIKVAVRDIDRTLEILGESEYSTFLGLFYFNGEHLERVRS